MADNRASRSQRGQSEARKGADDYNNTLDSQGRIFSPLRYSKQGTPKAESRNLFSANAQRNGTAASQKRYGARVLQPRGNSARASYNGPIQAQSANSTAIWEAFGAYIARIMKGGRGVWVPKLGIFTFTAMNVDLAGSTNPGIRDKQERFPVFIVGKDFVSAIPMKAAISSGMSGDAYEKGDTNKIRPFVQHAGSGIIPKVKINYTEIAVQVGASKDECRTAVEALIQSSSAQARNGLAVDAKIPNVGRLVVKNNLAGVVFDQSIIDLSRGQTAKNFETPYQGNGWMNNKLYLANKTNYGDYAEAQDLSNSIEFQRSPQKVSMEARRWLKQNLDFDLDKNFVSRTSLQTPPINSLKQKKALQIGSPTNQQENRLNQLRSQFSAQKNSRPGSEANFRNSRAGVQVASILSQSRYSSTYSRMSKLPDLAPFQFMNMATEIYNQRASICEGIRSGTGVISLRDVLPSTKIMKVLSQTCAYKIEIGNLKALLKELGFNWNGPSCSIQQLLQKIKEYVNPASAYKPTGDQYVTSALRPRDMIIPAEQGTLLGLKRKEGAHTVTEIIKEQFYSTGKTNYEIFKEGAPGSKMTYEAFLQLMKNYTNHQIQDEDIKEVFTKITNSITKSSITFQEFDQAFKIDIPVPGIQQNETKVIAKVREWMFQRQFATHNAWQRLVRASDRLFEGSMRRVDFHKAIIANQVKLTAPEIDFLFDILSFNIGEEIKYEHWSSRIFDDSVNPLQVIREAIVAENLDPDDVLFQMKLRAWDEPMEFKPFLKALRRIDPSFSEAQTRHLFDKLMNSNGKVEVQTFLTNVTGQKNETVDYKNKMLRLLYKEIYEKDKAREFLYLLEQKDVNNLGKIAPTDLEEVINDITRGKFTMDDIRKFVRQIERDVRHQINYCEFIDKICGLGNKDHNPFKSIISRLAYFIENNALTAHTLLQRLGATFNNPILVSKWAEFLKAKVEKRRSMNDLIGYANLMDIDKDGYINEQDLGTCLANVHSTSFFENGAISLKTATFNNKYNFYPTTLKNDITNTKIVSVCAHIRQGMQAKKVAYQRLFRLCDTEKVQMINLAQFSQGVTSIVSIAPPLLEKLFNVMDTNKIGMVDYPRFERILSIQANSQVPKPGDSVEDSFDWQERIIFEIKRWVKQSKLISTEAFRSFDKDFDGLISKEDMKQSLIEYLRVPAEEIINTRLDRLFRILSYYKTDKIQLTDFDRLLNDVSPYVSSATGTTDTKFTSTMGGGFAQTSTHDWKLAAIQQIGLVISHKYSTLEDSFDEASRNTERVTFDSFVEFIQKSDILRGFNLTMTLYQKLFAELDPHKKTYVSLKDWKDAFQAFNNRDHHMVELKNFLQVQFANCSSAWAFFHSLAGGQDVLDYQVFSKAAQNLIASRTLSTDKMLHLFRTISSDGKIITEQDFTREFSNVSYSGKQILRVPKSKNATSARTVDADNSVFATKQATQVDNFINSKFNKSKLRTSRAEGGGVQTQKLIGNVAASKWEADVMDKLRRLIKSSGKTIDAVFANFDVDGSGDVNEKEFRKAMKLISLGLTDQEIDKIMARVDANQDGMVSYTEFATRFRDDPDFDERMVQRAGQKIQKLKESFYLYMTSPWEAFRQFDSTASGRLNYLDFDRLIREISSLAKEPVPCFSVIRDMFDTIDFRGDQQLDEKEWMKAFGNKPKNEKTRVSVKQQVDPHSNWETSYDAHKIGECLALNRQLLTQRFQQFSTHSDHLGESRFVTFEQAKQALDQVLYENFTARGVRITNGQLQKIMSVGQVKKSVIYDYQKILDHYSSKHM